MTTEKKEVSAEDFDAAFAEAVQSLEESGATTEVTTSKTETPAPKVDETPAPKVDETPAPKVDETPAPKVDETPAPKVDETPAPKVDETPAPKPVPDPVEATATRVAEATAKAITEEQRRVAEAAEAKRVAGEEAAAAAEKNRIVDPVLSAEETKAIEEYRKEWPEQAKVFDTLLSHKTAELEARFARTLVEVVGKVYKDIQPMAEAVSTVEGSTYRKAVLEAHPDYDTLDPKLEGWIKTQPAYLQPAYMHVYNDGTAQEFVALVSDFKKSQGAAAQTPDAPVTPEPPKTPTRSPAAAAKAASMAPVNSQRSVPAPKGVDPNNFDDAFAEAAAQYK